MLGMFPVVDGRRVDLSQLWIPKRNLTFDNVNDPSIALNLDNLLLLCKECHNKMHGRFNEKQPKYKWNDDEALVEVREEENR